MARFDGIDPATATGEIAAILRAQTARWGAPLENHRLYARRPTVFRGVRAMWTGLDASGLLEPPLVALLNRRVAILNNCEF
ncbi:MAG: hypothetical protein AVDCRST_MAG73-4007 [uncultured Thermomicrobiales bacterium]|uniref:Carboxymuconolactone decarboxylase-like domain-containing protein n=1 Tax=uncultured Thermomicrobiales bacterium TaxID=1645740 RepID=A0A6J4UZC0_9BACT|nr:MAG: hypothetical protein AVDCRST_MAG73-4007 [uncultured Thermomicrobiales bacterium]